MCVSVFYNARRLACSSLFIHYVIVFSVAFRVQLPSVLKSAVFMSHESH